MVKVLTKQLQKNVLFVPLIEYAHREIARSLHMRIGSMHNL